MAVQSRFNDVDAGVVAAKKADELADRIVGVNKLIEVKKAEVAGMDNTFSTNKQICNRFEQLQEVLGKLVEPLNTVAKDVQKLANASQQALEASKTGIL